MGRSIACLAVMIVTGAFGAGASSLANAADDNAGLNTAVQTILAGQCAGCHANGAAEGGFDYVLSGARLVQRRKVVPRNTAGSKL